MKTKLIRWHTLAVVCALLAPALHSCNDECDDCGSAPRTRTLELTLKVVDGEGEDITATEAIRTACLFVFDEHGDYLYTQRLDIDEVKAGKPVTLDVGANRTVTVAAWSNMYFCGSIDRSDIGNIHSLDVPVYISLVRDDQQYNKTPSEVFHSVHTFETTVSTRAVKQIVLESKVAKVRITTRRLRVWANAQNWSQLGFDLTGTTDKYSVAKCLFGTSGAKYRPTLAYDAENYHGSASLNTFPSANGQGVAVNIYKDGAPIFCADRDSGGNQMLARAGKLLDIVIDFSAGVEVTATLKPWDEVGQGTEF